MRKTCGNRRGGAMLELAFYLPWIFFLFIGAMDWGSYAYALVSVENATRVAVIYTSSGNATDSTTACTLVLNELKNLPNIGSSVTTCGGSSPVSVAATAVTGPDGGSAAQVSVTYQTVGLVPIPGLLANSFKWTRTEIMRLRT